MKILTRYWCTIACLIAAAVNLPFVSDSVLNSFAVPFLFVCAVVCFIFDSDLV